MSKGFIRVIILLALTSLCACGRVRFESAVSAQNPASAQEPVRLKQRFFLFGLIHEATIDLHKECPNGVASFGDRALPLDMLFSIFTIGIYTPRTVIIECQQGQESKESKEPKESK